MSDFDRTDDGALLSAWLSGDLDAAEAATVEHRLASEPELAARLERVHGLLVALRGLDTIEPPVGMSERLHHRLAQERRQVPSLAAARARRSTRWQPILGAAAAVVLLAVLVPVLTRSAGESQTTAAPAGYAAEGGGEGGDSAAAPQAADEQASEASEAEAAGAEVSAELPGPVVTEVDLPGAASADPEVALAERSFGAEEADALLGLPVQEAFVVARDYAAQLRDAAPFSSGAAPAACLDAVQAGRRAAVPVRVEGFMLSGQPRLGYVLVIASPGSDVLDRVDTVVADPATC